MVDQYRILHLEDIATDAELVKFELMENKIDFDYLLIDSKDEYSNALDHFHPDVILCDHALPAFNSFEALRILRARKLSIPFIVITATMTEELAMTIVKEGADDYILKDRLKRLPHAVMNAIEKFRFEKERIDLIDRVYEREALSNQLLSELSNKILLATKVAGLGIWEYTFEQNKFIPDEVMLEQYGMTAKDFDNSYEMFIEYIHPDDRERVMSAFKDGLTQAVDLNTHYRIVWKNGSIHYIKAMALIQRDNNGNPLRLVGTTQDVTGEKQAEEKFQITFRALENAMRDSKKIMDSSLDIIAIIDAGGRWVKMSAASETMWGYTSEELAGKLYIDFVHPDDREKTAIIATEIMRGKEITNFENRYIRKDGSIVPIIWSANWDEADQLMFCVARNGTEKQEVEKIIEGERWRYAELFKQASAFICILNGPNHIYQMVNTDYEKLVGRKDFIGRSVKDVLPEIEGQGFLECLDSVYQTGETFAADEMLVTLNGDNKEFNDHYVNFSYQAYRNIKNEIEGIFVFGTDITGQVLSRKKIEESEKKYRKSAQDLELSNAELEQFAYVASHDLQEPLRMITSFLTQLDKKYGEIIDEKGKQYIAFAVDGAKRMRQVILDLLEFSKVGRIDDEREIIDLNELVSEIQILLRKKIEEINAIIIVGKLPTINAHRGPTRQIFQNLISNALKYSRENVQPEIQITATISGEYWQFKVSDNGIGIDSEYFQKIFVIFQQLHTKAEYPGSGIGLAIAKKIVENLGGKIWVESEENKGSTFFFTLSKHQLE